MKTKEQIYNKSIELFATQCYNEIGMREIAEHVGIKAASIYNHYSSKEDILLDVALHFIKLLKEEIYPLYKVNTTDFKAFFTNIAISTNNFFERSDVLALIKIIVSCLYQSDRLKALIHQEFYIKPRSALTYYFNDLTKKGILQIKDSEFAAKVYHSFFIYHFFEKFLLTNNDNFFTDKADLFQQHINFFLDYFSIK